MIAYQYIRFEFLAIYVPKLHICQSYIHYFTIVNRIPLFPSAFHKTKIFKIDYFELWKSYYDSDWLFTRR